MQSDPLKAEEAFEDSDTMWIYESRDPSTSGGGGGGGSGSDATYNSGGDGGGGSGAGSPQTTDGTPAVEIGALSLHKDDPDRPGMVIWGFAVAVNGVAGEIRFRTTTAYSEEGARLAARAILEDHPERMRPVSGWV